VCEQPSVMQSTVPGKVIECGVSQREYACRKWPDGRLYVIDEDGNERPVLVSQNQPPFLGPVESNRPILEEDGNARTSI